MLIFVFSSLPCVLNCIWSCQCCASSVIHVYDLVYYLFKLLEKAFNLLLTFEPFHEETYLITRAWLDLFLNELETWLSSHACKLYIISISSVFCVPRLSESQMTNLPFHLKLQEFWLVADFLAKYQIPSDISRTWCICKSSTPYTWFGPYMCMIGFGQARTCSLNSVIHYSSGHHKYLNSSFQYIAEL